MNYQELYDRIAHDHVDHWRKRGSNPWQGPEQIKANEDVTVGLIPEGSLLDVGCGMGDLLLRFPDRERHGIDISGEYLAVARERGLNVTLAHAEHIPFPAKSFDVVVATDILEHVFDVNKVARELKRVTRKWIVVRVPKDDEVVWAEPYGFVHLRLFDEGTLRALFGLILGCTVTDCFEKDGCVHMAATK